MPKSNEDVSRLFRSLGADDANFRASNSGAVRAAEQRWPLFKAVSPKKQVETPALTEDAKQHWGSSGKPRTSLRTPALTLPGLGDKLAQSLTKMAAEQPTRAISPRHQQRAETKEIAETGHRDMRPEVQEQPAERRGFFFSKPVEEEAPSEETTARPGLFRKNNREPLPAAPQAPAASDNEQSLSGLFARLEGKEEPARTRTDNRTSFFGRLGKR
ncbi:hypothetical protein [Noviherbaspirillum saxi]|uniref:Uncharacterized protein n=1 Tax=Noviherbaspirillum saxi TaxID=2320863 RepID=A0A3A3FGY2_9BURK|nr:hypothetical protein [Noviherbaspirillum saxi]RJF92430.1 hypothetical protein D3871_27830 [Noviherbaspirillum saxi]